MTKNIGRLDQVIRICASLSLIYIGIIDANFIADPLSSNIIGVVGVLNLIIALTRVCPLYIFVDINTLKGKKNKT